MTKRYGWANAEYVNEMASRNRVYVVTKIFDDGKKYYLREWRRGCKPSFDSLMSEAHRYAWSEAKQVAGKIDGAGAEHI